MKQSTPLSPESSQAALKLALEKFSERQLLDPSHPLHGAVLNPESGVDEPGHTGTCLLVASILLLQATKEGGHSCLPNPSLTAAVDYLLRAQRPTGRLDLRGCNYDSEPDTAFSVQILCAAYSVRDANWESDSTLKKLGQFLQNAGRGIAEGGFHTPNHRWVMAAAMAQLSGLLPALAPDFEPAFSKLLAEQPDIDADGCFIERSVAIYDPVSDRALMLIDECKPGGWEIGRLAALANLDFDFHLLHSDGTVETGLSHRQDHGLREVPENLIPVLLQASRRTGNPHYAAVAAWLWDRLETMRLPAAFWTCLEMVKAPSHPVAQAPGDGSAYFPTNQIWRLRKGRMSVSAFGGQTRLLGLRFGEAELVALKIGQCYLGHGSFIAREIQADGDRVLLRSPGGNEDVGPRYFRPLGREFAPLDWDAIRAKRPFRALSPCQSVLEIQADDEVLTLHYRTEAGLENVLTVLALDFLPGGVWESSDTAFKPMPGQILFLKSGAGRMRYGSWTLEISGGAEAHRYWEPRDFEAPGPCVRVLIPFLTPVDHRFCIRGLKSSPLPS